MLCGRFVDVDGGTLTLSQLAFQAHLIRPHMLPQKREIRMMAGGFLSSNEIQIQLTPSLGALGHLIHLDLDGWGLSVYDLSLVFYLVDEHR